MTPPPPVPRSRRRKGCFLALILLGSGTMLMLNWLERRLVYPGQTAAEAWVDPPVPDVEDVWITTASGTKIHGWFLRDSTSTDVILFAHGNGGNLSHRGRTAVELRRTLGRSVLLFDYPGYGKSEGQPSEKTCYAAGDAAVAWLVTQQFPKSRMLFLGESLGGGVATELATRHQHKALILAKTFTSLPAVAKISFPGLPAHTLMSNRYNNLAKLPTITTPVFIAHGTADTLIPFHHAEELYAAANPPKYLHRMEGENHNAWFTSAFYEALKQFLDEYAK